MTDLTLCLTGDSLITRSWAGCTGSGFHSILGIVRRSDAAFTNLEVPLHDYVSWPAAEAQGPHLRGPPAVATNLASAGFNLISLANNHMLDWDVTGLRSTLDHLRKAGLNPAGAGESQEAARAARYIDTPRGRIALIACTATYPAHARAGRECGQHPARPGISVLRHSRTIMVTPEQLANLRDLQAALDLPSDWGYGATPDHQLNWLNQQFVAGDTTTLLTRPHARDLADILAIINTAESQAELVMVSIHTHEQQRRDRHDIPDFIRTCARAMVDAGASLIVGHGPHLVRGIETYRGKLIFYSLGNFIFQPGTLPLLAEDDHEALGIETDSRPGSTGPHRWNRAMARHLMESIAVQLTWRDRQLDTAQLIPLELDNGVGSPSQGLPMPATPETAAKILTELSNRSKPLGTHIDTDGVCGRIAISGLRG